jgi:hypothetical protein
MQLRTSPGVQRDGAGWEGKDRVAMKQSYVDFRRFGGGRGVICVGHATLLRKAAP